MIGCICGGVLELAIASVGAVSMLVGHLVLKFLGR
jgi:hypothetical protein